VVDSKTTCFLVHNHTITTTVGRKTASHKLLTVSVNHVTHVLVLVFLQALSLVLAVVSW